MCQAMRLEISIAFKLYKSVMQNWSTAADQILNVASRQTENAAIERSLLFEMSRSTLSYCNAISLSVSALVLLRCSLKVYLMV